MAVINVKNSIRKTKRDLKNALGDDILRYIIELVTNSDDSYRRIEANIKNDLSDEEKVIYIEVNENYNQNTKEIEFSLSITDNAEGMNKITLERIFGTYGNDNAGGVSLHARGIFGQGASDVLRSSARENKIALIETIKDNKVYTLTYKMDEELNPSIVTNVLKLSKSKLLQKRKELRIPKNGTRITFGIPSTVKFNEKIKNKLPTLIEKNPSFRYLLNKENRTILFVDNFLEQPLSSQNYQFVADNLILNKNIFFNFESKKINCNLKLYKNNNKHHDDTNIIVRDENYNVFDNTMFDFQNFATAQNLSGELLINGLYNICYEHLNSENPDAIVRDNRTGFDTKHPFYIELNKKISPEIDEILKHYENETKKTDLTNNKKFNEALKKLNKYLYSELQESPKGGNVKELIPPKEGIKFANSSIEIVKGKQFNLKLLINSDIIPSDTEIKLLCDNNNNIEYNPNCVSFSMDEIDGSVIVKNISIKALEKTFEPIILTALADTRISNVIINVVEEEIYIPEEGMEFINKETTSSFGKTHNLKLYINSNIVPLDSEIKIKCDGLNVINSNIIFNKNKLLSKETGLIIIELTGGEIDECYIVEATYKDISAKTRLTIIEPKKNENLKNGYIAGVILESSDLLYQAYYNPRTHKIYINVNNPINKKIMGEMKDKNPDNPSFNKEQSKYLCDIISSQAANFIVKNQNIKNGEINFDDPEDAIDKVLNLVQEHKNNIFRELYSSLVGKEK